MADRERTGVDAQPPHALHRPALAGALSVGVAVLLAAAVTGLPSVTATLPVIARHAMQIALPTWGQDEVVSEIVYGSRGFDTFGETFLLLAAVMSVMLLTRGREPRAEYVGEATAGRREQQEVDPAGHPDSIEAQTRSAEQSEDAGSEESREENLPPPEPVPDNIGLGVPGPDRTEAMTVPIRVAARTAAVFLAVAAVYLAAWGYTPGGGFPAGAALTGVAVLLYTALGHQLVSKVVRPNLLEPIELAGAVAIIGIGLAGLIRSGALFANFLPLAVPGTIRAGGSEQLYSGAELIEVATGLSIAIFSLLGVGHDWAPDEDDEQEDDA